MKKLILLILPFILYNNLRAQNELELFPDDLTIQPFIANQLEPKLGFLIQVNTNELRLDIGNSVDILRHEKDNETFSFGADLFTYTLLRGEKNFHFPVDAVDYLFGVNAGYKLEADSYEYGLRFRLSHISAHFVDGHFDGVNQRWIDGISPIVYSREFIELAPYYRTGNLRVYSVFTYIFHVDPAQLGKDNYQIGFDYIEENVFSGWGHLFAGCDLKLVNLEEYSLNKSLVVGAKIGKPHGKGLSIFLNYFSGKSIHGEYYYLDKDYFAIGMNLDL